MKLEELWAEYRSALKAFLHSKINNAADVDDVLQDILVKTHKNLASIRDPKSIKSWLFQTANHTIIDFYRRNGKGKEVKAEDLWFNDDEINIKAELSHCIEPFINALPDESSELLTAIDLNGEAQKAYAEAHGISYSTLKSRVQKARTQLRGQFEDCCKMQLDAQGNLMEYEQKSTNNRNKDCGIC